MLQCVNQINLFKREKKWKKLLTILSSLGLIATSSLFVISCKNNISRSDKENTNSDQKREKSKRPATEEEKNKLQAI
ncbi:lipoprotein [Mycoplasma capricolum]|uniref:lipoprotein n=1 Tax=Mycoplasma capricolum TaxID=2095 RepID=UPI003DA34657